MMKFGSFVQVAIGAVLVLPAVTLEQGGGGSLEETLRRTLRALESLGGLEQQIAARDPSAVAELMRWTEPAPADSAARQAADRQLEELRGEVAALEARVEPEVDRGSGAASADMAGDTSLAPATTGLDEAARRALRSIVPQSTATTAKPEPEPAPVQREALEPEGYLADALRLGRALYLQGRYEQSLAVLEPAELGPTALYWRARGLERLGRFDEALACYRSLTADAAGSFEAERAKEDAEFLEWRLAFERRTAAKRGTEASKP
jgi:tetratricopeptide (TPR) repeat protein